MSTSTVKSSPPMVPDVIALPAPAVVPAKRNLIKPVVIGVVVAGALAWLAQYAVHAYHYVKTDNAYVVGHLHLVSPQIDGQVQAVLVQDNQDVKRGDVLVRIDPLEFEIGRQKALASLAQARAQEAQTGAATAQADAQLAEAGARVTQADAQIVQARAQLELSQLTLTRNERLFKDGGAVTQADVDTARSGFQVAQAAHDAASANRAAAQAAVGSAQAAQKSAVSQALAAAANVQAAQSALNDADRQLAYATITAPSDGRVGNKNVEPGNRILAGQTLLALTERDPWIVANFKETQLAHLQVGQEVAITVDALPGLRLHGTVDSLSPASGAQFALLPPDNATGNFNKVVQRIPVKIVLSPASVAEVGDRLRFGYSVVVDVRVR